MGKFMRHHEFTLNPWFWAIRGSGEHPRQGASRAGGSPIVASRRVTWLESSDRAAGALVSQLEAQKLAVSTRDLRRGLGLRGGTTSRCIPGAVRRAAPGARRRSLHVGSASPEVDGLHETGTQGGEVVARRGLRSSRRARAKRTTSGDQAEESRAPAAPHPCESHAPAAIPFRTTNEKAAGRKAPRPSLLPT